MLLLDLYFHVKQRARLLRAKEQAISTQPLPPAPDERPAIRGKQAQRGRAWDVILIAAGLIGVALLWVITGGGGARSSGGAASTPTGSAPVQARVGLMQGSLAPDFSLPSTEGKFVALSSLRGKVVVLEFMAPWCPHCQDAVPDLNAIYRKWGDAGVAVIGVSGTPFGHNYENGDTAPITMDDMTWFRDTYKTEYTLLFDKNVAQAQAYGITHFPFIYIIGADGKVVTQLNNPANVETVAPYIEQALNSANSPAPVARIGGPGN